MGIFAKYPYTDFNNLNLDWIIGRLREVEAELQKYLDNAVIKFADPITWDITEQYTALTVVVDSDGTAYLSKQPVPAGIDLTNTDYWLPIFNYDDNINQLRSQIAYNAQNSATTDADLHANDLVFWHGYIYKALADIPAGSALIPDTNVVQYTVNERINDVDGAVQTVAQDLSDSVTTLEAEIAAIPEADIRTFLDVAEMKAADVEEGEKLKTVYHTNEADGGGAYYIATTDTPNGFDVIALDNGLSATLVQPAELDIAMFGAVGGTDVYLIMNAAVAYADNKHINIFVKCNDYHLSGTINLNVSGITFKGEYGRMYTDSDRRWHFIVDGDYPAFETARATQSLVFDTLYFKGVQNPYIGKGIVFNTSNRCRVQNCLFYYLGEAINCNMSANGWSGEFFIDDNLIQYCGIGIHFTRSTGVSNAVTDSFIRGNIIAHLTGNFLNASNLDGFVITENHCYGSKGMYCPNTRGVVIANNYFDNGTDGSINLEGNDARVSICNNFFLIYGDSSATGAIIWIHGGEAVIENNTITDEANAAGLYFIQNHPSAVIRANGNIGYAIDKMFATTAHRERIGSHLTPSVYCFQCQFNGTDVAQTFNFPFTFSSAPTLLGGTLFANGMSLQLSSYITDIRTTTTGITITRTSASAFANTYFSVIVAENIYDYDLS